jgi:16S rRNA (cytosine1402-N4)-methyltransferase
MIHRPVLLQEVINALQLAPNDNIIDGTLGEGGHAAHILSLIAPHGILLGIDRDSGQIERANTYLAAYQERVLFVHSSFAHIADIAGQYPYTWKGIFLDLGWSQVHIEDTKRGFSFQKDEPLDMRYDRREKLTAAQIVSTYREEKLITLLQEYGDESFAKRIAKEIVNSRRHKKITGTFQLVEIIKKATPVWYHHRKIHPATKTFQALRIAVNHEYEEIEQGLEGAIDILSPGGVLVIITFHSGEDRVVKRKLQNFQKNEIGKMIPKKPVTPSFKEQQQNPRSRSAKLRIFHIKS